MSVEEGIFIIDLILLGCALLTLFGFDHWFRKRMNNLNKAPASPWTLREKIMAFLLILSVASSAFGLFRSWTHQSIAHPMAFGFGVSASEAIRG